MLKRSKWRWGSLIFILLVLFLFLGQAYQSGQRRQEVYQVLMATQDGQLPAKTNVVQLLEMGSRAHPTLGYFLTKQARPWDKFYAFLYAKSPRLVKKRLSPPVDPATIRTRAAAMVREMGPMAARPLCGHLIAALPSQDLMHQMNLLNGLYWSLPESPKAMAALSNAIVQGPFLFGNVYTTNLWPKIPSVVPALIPALLKRGTFQEAAGALAMLGTNARPAVPALLQVAKQGLKEQDNLIPMIPDSIRGTALYALSRIDPHHPEVRKLLEDAIRGSLELKVRALEILAWMKVEDPWIEQAFVVATSDPSVRANFCRAAQSLGPRAKSAIPWLEEMARSSSIDDSQLAMVTLCHIDIQLQEVWLPRLLNAPRTFAAHQYLRSRPDLSKATRQILEKTIQEKGTNALWTALQLTRSGIRSEDALKLAQDSLAKRDPLKWASAMALVQGGFREFDAEVYQLVRSTLNQPNSPDLQSALSVVELMDKSSVRVLAPELKTALTHPDVHFRYRASRLVHEMAPELLPKIREKKF